MSKIKNYVIRATPEQVEFFEQEFLPSLDKSDQDSPTGFWQRLFDRFTEGKVEYNTEVSVKIQKP